GGSVTELVLQRQGPMIAVPPTLSKPPAAPIFTVGMMCYRGVRPDDFPILERTGQPLPASLFCRPPACVPPGQTPRRRAAYRSSVLDDQAYADRCHARGRNPRRGAGW